MRLWQLAVRRPVGTTVIYLAIGLFGYVSLRQLSIDLLPSVDMPSISITTAYEGVAPEEIETLITRPLEQAVSRIQGVDRLEAVSAEGLSRIQLRFHWGQDLSQALDDVRMAIDRVRAQLPEDAEPPTVYKFDLASAPVAGVGVTGAGDPRALKHFAEDALARRLERVPGVASATARGGRDREIRIELSAERLSALGVTAERVAEAVRAENRTVSAGDMRDSGREVVIRTAGEYERVEDIASVVVGVRDQQPIRVSDVGEVVDGAREQRSELWIDGQPGIELRIYKQSGANTIAVADGVAREIEAINREHAGQVHLSTLWDTSDFIRSAVDNVQLSAIVGAGLAILVLLMFLGDVRATAVIATSIPLSVLATFGLMRFSGITLNLISFGGLALGVGMLVDSAIVILESIHHTRGGTGPVEAAERGTGQVALAVAAGTLTTVAVFVPVVYLGDFAGVFFRELAAVVSFALAASLLVALTLVPMLAARLLKRVDKSALAAESGVLARLEAGYGRVLGGALESPGLVVGLACVLLVASALLLPHIGLELAPQTDEGRLDVDVELPVGTPIEHTMRVMQDIEGRVRKVTQPEEIEHLVTTAGPENWWRAQGSNEGEVDVLLVPVSERERSAEEIHAAVQAAVTNIPGAEVRVRQFATNPLMRFMRGGGDDRLRIEIRGQELDVADALAKRLVAALDDVAGVTHARPDRELGQLERVVRVDRARAAELGLGNAEIASAVEHYVLGRVATRFREHGDEYDVRVVLREQDRQHLAQLTQLPVLAADGRLVPLSALARIEEQRGPSSIARLDQERILRIDVGTSGERAFNEIAADVSAIVSDMELPAEFSVLLTGELEEQRETFDALLFGIVLAIFLVYAVMAVQFESARHPLVIMVSVPFAFTGVALALLVTSTTFNMYSFLGTIVLVGIAVNNAIVLIDYTNLLRREHDRPIVAALVEAGTRRLRPILMTTLTTVLAMVPLAWASGEGNEIQAPLARVVIGGLVSSTVVTLLVIPCVYLLFETVPERVRRTVASIRKGGSHASSVRRS